jgi:hypothetical protein
MLFNKKLKKTKQNKRKKTLPPSCADCLEIWEPQPPGTLKAI